jgi:DNA-binding transcriptional MerR regulator/effector-binding domain-containing protein
VNGEDGVVDDALLPIGMFSRASSLSIKSLRAYHDAGILVPARVDPQSGYRSYTVDQLADAAVIVRLRALDVPLPQVDAVLRHRDPVFTRQVLTEHQRTMQARFDDLERILGELQSGSVDVTHTPVHVRFEAASHTLATSRRVDASQLWDWLAEAFAGLELAAGELGATTTGVASASYAAEIAEDDIEDVEAYVPIAEPVVVRGVASGVRLGEIPAGWVAVLVHTGDYDSILDTYRTLGAWVARNAEHAGTPVREQYLVGASDVDDPGAYRTEILWPIDAPE